MIVILGTGGRSVSGVTLLEEPLVAAWPCVVCPSLGPCRSGPPGWPNAGTYRAAWKPSPSPSKPLVGVTSHLVSGQGRGLSWEKIPEASGLRGGFQAGGEE